MEAAGTNESARNCKVRQSAALNVGQSQVMENEPVGKRGLRFFVTAAQALRDGAPISLGWVGQPAQGGKAEFRYRAPTESTTR